MGFFYIVASFAGDSSDNGSPPFGATVVDAGGAITAPGIA